jgi:hypothetical protein
MFYLFLITAILIGAIIGYMSINKTANPYQEWTRDEFMSQLEKHEEIMNLSTSMLRYYRHMVYSEAWNPQIQFNGCSIVQDSYHPDPNCFNHDYAWVTGQGGYLSDRLFYVCMVASGMGKSRAKARWIFVRIGWLGYYKWKHLAARNVNPICEEFEAVIEELGLRKMKVLFS